MKIKITAYLLTIGLFLLSFILIFVIEHLLLAALRIAPHSFQGAISIYAFTTLALPSVCSFLVARFFVRWFQKRNNISIKWRLQDRWTILLLIVLYLLTAVLGSPMVQNENTKWAIEEYKRIHEDANAKVWESHPYIGTYLSIPILPFVVLSYHEYQLAGLYGWGGWDVQVWYISGVRRILSIPVWLS